MPYSEYCSQLPPAEAFDPQIFVWDTDMPREVCDFVLALALLYNDIKGVYLLHSLLLEVKPDGNVAENAAWGEHFGFLTQILRLQAGILDEALRLIRKSHAAVDHPALLGIVGQLPPGARRFWRTFVDHARGKKSSGSLGKALAMVRNNVSFHYEPAELGDAYRRRFSGRQRPPFVSRGRSLASTRFYFADAAVERYMFRDAPEEAGRILFDVDFLNSLHGALWGIIQRFLQREATGVS